MCLCSTFSEHRNPQFRRQLLETVQVPRAGVEHADQLKPPRSLVCQPPVAQSEEMQDTFLYNML